MIDHIPLSALLLLAWCVASLVARGLQARQMRRYREMLGSTHVGVAWDGYRHPNGEDGRAEVATAVPIFTGQIVQVGGGVAQEPPGEQSTGTSTEADAQAVVASAPGDMPDGPPPVVGRRVLL